MKKDFGCLKCSFQKRTFKPGFPSFLRKMPGCADTKEHEDALNRFMYSTLKPSWRPRTLNWKLTRRPVAAAPSSCPPRKSSWAGRRGPLWWWKSESREARHTVKGRPGNQVGRHVPSGRKRSPWRWWPRRSPGNGMYTGMPNAFPKQASSEGTWWKYIPPSDDERRNCRASPWTDDSACCPPS